MAQKPDSRGRYLKTQRAFFWDAESLAAQRLAGKSSRHAQRIFGADAPSRTLLLEYVRGKSLEDASPAFLRRNKTQIIRQLASALAEHSEVLHRDLNTGNIILSAGGRRGRIVHPMRLKLIDYEKASIRPYPLDMDLYAGFVGNFDYSKIRNEIIPSICERIGEAGAKKLQDRFEREFVKSMAQRAPELKGIKTMQGYVTYMIKRAPLFMPNKEQLVNSSLQSLGRRFVEYSKKQIPEKKMEAAAPMEKTGVARLKERIRRARWKKAMLARGGYG